MPSWLRSMLGFSRNEPNSGRALFDDARVTVHCQRAPTQSIGWNEIKRIEAWKRDLFTVDEIIIELWGRVDSVVVSENDLGYDEFLEELARRFELSDGWWSRVAFPAFTESRTVLWSK